ncbi:unnamed protein product [Blepharisma stoltei]|uniref:Uncharacterized protein n=1 Tax=Blepharisma stoltei TaxID=1481888 RepID=A0AAU9JIJ1_9CILI|nr:unnamed protein product [Blepharisma stoltei]
MEDISNKIYELFRYTFIANCDIDEAPMTQEEIDTLDALQPPEILENLKDIITELLDFKREFKTTDSAELMKRAEQFETMLQKLEAEARVHIQIEQQMKLQLDIAKSKVEEYEKMNKISQKHKNQLNLRLDIKLDHSPITNKEEKAVSYRENYKEIDKIKKKYENKLQKLIEDSENKDKNIKMLEVECTKLKIILEEKEKEFDKLRNQVKNMPADIIDLRKLEKRTIISTGYLKKKQDEKSLGILRYNSQIKGGTPLKDVKIRKTPGKSIGNELPKDSSPYGMWNEANNSYKKISMMKKFEITPHKHFRSFSEYDKVKKIST